MGHVDGQQQMSTLRHESASSGSTGKRTKRRSPSNSSSRDSDYRHDERLKSRRRSSSHDRDSSSSSSDGDREEDESIEEDDATESDRSSLSSVKEVIRWDYRINLIGRRVKDTKAFCCFSCAYPVLVAGRLLPCKHVFCLQCAQKCKNDRRNCSKCNDAINDLEKIEAKNLIMCLYGGHRNSHDVCLRGYTSQRDLNAHVKRRHERNSGTNISTPSVNESLSPRSQQKDNFSNYPQPTGHIPSQSNVSQQQAPPSHPTRLPPPTLAGLDSLSNNLYDPLALFHQNDHFPRAPMLSGVAPLPPPPPPLPFVGSTSQTTQPPLRYPTPHNQYPQIPGSYLQPPLQTSHVFTNPQPHQYY
ncbi:unnamed protein product [Didymodactylos carnosus]|uniref:E3 ubiquitin-protein ligase Hakai n=1 Tax=Didymodactylos carnosus TaxID=1234261 RepID=A0A814FBY5_9BILA|nr:unnamed protein product [Didymodactylos carnosus]CAF0978594.1 unnamed protein product [Didymodactylos carnosus]CAF3599649.1 unnamed protein product [Didymodactylos carnosus]CAF3751355.1 unnamed protein product [Didymodactylos carnosus]